MHLKSRQIQYFDELQRTIADFTTIRLNMYTTICSFRFAYKHMYMHFKKDVNFNILMNNKEPLLISITFTRTHLSLNPVKYRY